MEASTDRVAEEVERYAPVVGAVIEQVQRVVVGQEHMVRGLVMGLLTGGHVLLEGVPGLAKTLAVSSLAKSLHVSFSRIQFTPDLLPADLIGTLIFSPKDGTFSPRKGPIFANIVLADEINRAPAKVQSALLEAMQERHVTIGDTTYELEEPFLVLATQNPIEQEGTYPLPEAQVDRFMVKIRVGYPSRENERLILDRMGTSDPDLVIDAVLSGEELLAARRVVDQIYVGDAVRDYIVDLVQATRTPEACVPGVGAELSGLIEYGASPRACLGLLLVSRAWAFLEGRAYVTPGDIKAVGMDVLRHRVLPSYEAQAEDVDAEQILGMIFDHLPVP